MMQLRANVVDEVVKHCRMAQPYEACGLLAAEAGVVVASIPVTNAACSPVGYALDPAEQFTAQGWIDAAGWELAGVYHSHLTTPAFPSPTDVRLAAEGTTYVIVSIAEDPPDVRAFRLTPEVEEVSIIVDVGIVMNDS